MIGALDHPSGVQAFGQVGVNLTFKEKFEQHSPLVGTIHVLQFNSREADRLLEVAFGKNVITIIVQDGKKTHRAVYDLETQCASSVETFVACITGKPEMIATLKGAEVVDTPFDWGDYK